MSDFRRRLGRRLRAIRIQQGYSLRDVEERSGGEWKSAVVGSYERGDRAISAQRLAELAEFYGVPIVEILPEDAASAVDDRQPPGVALDLVKLVEDADPEVKPIQRWVSLVQKQRGDFNRKMLTIRGEDVRLLAAACDTTPAELVELLAARGILSKSV